MPLELPNSSSIPTRSAWREIRTKAGGKKGLAKVDLGGGIEKFHAAYATHKDKKAVAEIWKLIRDTQNNLLAKYVSDLKALPNGATQYKDLIAAVETKLDKPLDELYTKVTAAQTKYSQEQTSLKEDAKIKVMEAVPVIKQLESVIKAAKKEHVESIKKGCETAETALKHARGKLKESGLTDADLTKNIDALDKRLKEVKTAVEKIK